MAIRVMTGYFDGDVDLERNVVNFKSLRIRTTNSSVAVRTCPEDGKLYFYATSGGNMYVK